jgi:mRNA interferase MazF
MAARVTISVSIPESLFHQAEVLAQQLSLSPDELFEAALEQFVRQADVDKSAGQKIHHGDLYWLRDSDPHPHVVVQENIFNHSRLQTVIVCSLTSNLNRVNIPGNVLLEAGEGNLPRQSVVEVSKLMTVDKTQLGEYIGSLNEQRVRQIFAGLRLLQRSFFDGQPSGE